MFIENTGVSNLKQNLNLQEDGIASKDLAVEISQSL